MTTFPTLAPRVAGETPEQFGIRAFSFLATTGIPVGCIPEEARAAALHFSILLVTAPDLLDATRERWADVRFQLARRAEADRKQALVADAPLQATSAPQDAPRGGGQRVARPVPPTRPTPPSTSAVTGKPLPTPEQALARIDAVKQRLASPAEVAKLRAAATAYFAEQDGGAL